MTLFLTIVIFKPAYVNAQGMMNNWTVSPASVSSDNHSAKEEAEGKTIWEKLQTKQLECNALTDENYQALGEYFMGKAIGNTQRHAAMNQMMIGMMGEEGEEQMHVVMGKRISGCDNSAQIPSSGLGFMPMMFLLHQSFGGQGLMGSAFSRLSSGFGGTKGGGNPMMGYGGWNNMMGWGGFGFFGWLFMIVFWAILILGVIALIRYLGIQGKGSNKEKAPLDILKERYAKGEINKKDFEEMKKDLK